MAQLELLPPGHPLLRTKLEPFDFKSETDAIEVARDLAETMLSKGGLGLAANQVGMPFRAFVIWGSPVQALFNPRITDASTDTVLLEESCLSFPGLVLTVKRPRAIRIRFELPSGETITRRFEGLTARVVQHEMEHLDGGLFFSKVSRPKLEGAIRRAKRAGFEYTIGGLRGKR